MDGTDNASACQHKLLLENASDLILVIQNNRIEFINQKPLADLGYTINDVKAENFFDFIHVDDKEKVAEYAIQRARNRELPDDLIFRMLTKENRLVFVKYISIPTEWNGKPAHLICVKNVTDTKLGVLTVKGSEYLLSTIINNLPDPTFVIDVNGKVYLWNKAMETLSNVKSQDIVGMAEYENAVPFHGYKGPALMDLMFAPEAEIKKVYDFFQRADDILIAGRFLPLAAEEGNHIWVTSSILYDIQGNIVGAVESFRDMTKIKKAEEEIKASIKEKEILVKEIHHRVRNNMQLIKSMLQIQLQNIKDPEAADLFKDSVSRIETMGLIHNDLYRYTTYADINFREFIPKLIDNLRAMYDRQEITMKIEAEEIHLGIDDAIPCALILNELISNSLKHAFTEGEAGTILVKIFCDANTGHCNVIVHDNGKGLSPDFDFAKNTTSFGLLMVKLLTRQLQGTVRLNSENGTEFTIAFPIKIHEE